MINDIEITPGNNVVLSGHGSTLSYEDNIVMGASFVKNIDDREEGSFVVLEKKHGRVIAHHAFRQLLASESESLFR